jgi:Cu(I)/Ag(I) efflux system membrane fusion protein
MNPTHLLSHWRGKALFFGLFIAALLGLHAMQRGVQNSGLVLAAGKPVYTCPMDPQIRQETPGKCSICGMNLVLENASAGSTDIKEKPAPTAPAAPKKARTPAVAGKYQCPMHPTIVQDGPGDCPICGMKLVKIKAAAGGKSESTSPAQPAAPDSMKPVPDTQSPASRTEVEIDPQRQQLIGLRTATATRSDMQSAWHTVGKLRADETRIRKVNVKTAGYVEQVFADFVGRPVHRGDPLFTYYSPDLVATQQEYLLALKNVQPENNPIPSDSMVLSALRLKLRYWDVPDAEIDRLEQTGQAAHTSTVVSPVSGVVTAKNIVQGSSLMPGEIAYEITDLNSIWVLADGYQSDSRRAQIGMSAVVTIESLPGRVFPGKVSFIDPLLDAQSRTFKIRVEVDNPNGELKPEMFADVQFQSASHAALTVPADAIVPTGRGQIVFIALGNGKFKPQSVTVGPKTDDRIEITSGLKEGDAVVTRANFLVDSESSLRASLAAMGE